MNNGTEQTPQTVNVKLTLPNAQLILNALSERPYREVASLISDLMAQIQNQLKPASPAFRFSPGQLTQRGKELWQAIRATDEEPFEGENSPWLKVGSDTIADLARWSSSGKVVIPGMGAKDHEGKPAPVVPQPASVKKEA